MPLSRSAAPALGAALGAFLLAGCANLEETMGDVFGDSGQDTERYAFACDDGRRLTVAFRDDRERARVRTDDETYQLELVDRGDDWRLYENDDARLMVEAGETVDLRVEDGDDFDNCRPVSS